MCSEVMLYAYVQKKHKCKELRFYYVPWQYFKWLLKLMCLFYFVTLKL